MPGLGTRPHPISTRNPEAQKFFNQGLELIYAFNHDEAAHSFSRAAELDPKSAMAHWGVALALGPNINMDVDPEHEKSAYEAVQKAVALQSGASEPERAYIAALARRYSNDPKADLKALSQDYSNAMRALVERYPDDLDAATLYAESMMDLRPWRLWTADGKPEEGTLEIVRVLESVIRRDPNHVGANHYYIHAVEASKSPERALPSADRLGKLAPAAGHLVHMPGHIYLQLGDYETVAKTNEAAAAADRQYMKASGNTTGMYPLMYYNHNVHFLMAARSAQGRFLAAKAAAGELAKNVQPALEQMPMLQAFASMPMFILVRFHKWGEVLRLPAPDEKFILLNGLWHWSRGVAFASTGKVAEAKNESTLFSAAIAKVPADLPWGVNPAPGVMRIAAEELAARIAESSGDRAGAIEHWRKAVKAQDEAGYDEPPTWYYPTRESLGGALLRSDRAADAETVFREDLQNNPRNPRSLFGLMECLKRQQKPGIEWVESQFTSQWQGAEIKLAVADL